MSTIHSPVGHFIYSTKSVGSLAANSPASYCCLLGAEPGAFRGFQELFFYRKQQLPSVAGKCV